MNIYGKWKRKKIGEYIITLSLVNLAITTMTNLISIRKRHSSHASRCPDQRSTWSWKVYCDGIGIPINNMQTHPKVRGETMPAILQIGAVGWVAIYVPATHLHYILLQLLLFYVHPRHVSWFNHLILSYDANGHFGQIF